MRVVHCGVKSTDAAQGQLHAGCKGSIMPGIISHRFSNPKDENRKSRQNPNPYNLSNNPNKIESLKRFGGLQNPNGEN